MSTVNLSIIGATTTPPTYALDATSLPTVVNGTIASNLFTANANAASAQTFDYVTATNTTAISANMKFTPSTILTIDPSSTTGSTKFNYSISNTVQVGSKILVDVAGTVNEITVAAGSQSTNAIFDSSWGALTLKYCNNKIFALGTDNRKFAYSEDSGLSWIYCTQFSGTGVTYMLTSVEYFNDFYYVGLMYGSSQGTINLWKSSDLLNWSSAHSQTFTNAGSCGVGIVNNKLVVAYSVNNGSGGNTLKLFNSVDGITFNTCASNEISINAGNAQIVSVITSNNKICIALEVYATYTTDADNFILSAASTTQPYKAVYWTGSIYIATKAGAGLGIYTSSNFSTWTQRANIQGANITYNNSIFLTADSGGTQVATSSDGITWAINTISGASLGQFFATPIFSGINFIINDSTPKIWRSSTGLSGWTSVNLSTNSGYTFTMTSPSIAKPAWAAIGGQQLQYSVSTTSTPSFSTATLSYTRSTNFVTATGANVTGLTGTHVQLKALTLNNADVLSQIGATITTVNVPYGSLLWNFV